MALTKITSNVVKDDAVTSAKIVDGGIATADIAANAVTSAKIAQNSILTKHIDDGQVTTDQLGADAVTSAKIADDAISEEHLDVTVITGLTEVTAATGDLLMVADISDSNNLKKIPVSSIQAGRLALTGGTITGTVVFNSAPTFNTAITMNSSLNVATTVGIAGTTVIDSSRNLTNIGTISSGAITSSGNLHAGDGTNISMDASANGQVEIDGNGYTGAIALDGAAMHVYHNSASRDLVLGTNETARLTIGGTGTFTFHSNNLQSIGTISSGAITSSGTLTINTDANSTFTVADGGLDAITLYAGTGDELYIGANNAYKLRFKTDGNIVMDNGGNFGIGETNPDAPLHITSNTPIISFDESDASQEYRIGSFGGSFAIYDSTDAAYRLVVNGSGNVGIGTSNPQMGLHVGSGSQSTAALPGIGIANGGSSYSFYQASDGTKQYIAGVDHNITYTKAGSLSNHSHSIITNNTNAIFINTSQNVGISTDDPLVKLDVRGSASAPATSGTAQTGSLRVSQTVGNGVLDMGFYTSSNGTAWLQSTNKANLATNYDIALQPNGGKVGIGTTSPTNARVHIVGDSSYVGDYGYNTLVLEDSSGYAGLNLRNGNNNWLMRNAGNNNSLQIVSSSNASGPGTGTYTPRLVIMQAGNVGIGTDDPSDKLEVSGTGGTRLKVTNTDTNWAGLDLQAGGNQANYLFFRDESAERSRIMADDGGSISFLTGASPVQRLKISTNDIVIGTGVANEAAKYISSGGTTVIRGADSNHSIVIRGTQDASGTVTGNVNTMGFYEYGGYEFYTKQGNTRHKSLEILPAGKFNITTSAPRSKYFDVNGVAEISESFTLNNGTQYDFEYTVGSEGGSGNSYFIIAGYNHYYNTSYGAHKVAFVSARTTSMATMINLGSQSSGGGGAWEFSKPSATTLRIRKTAGTYVGNGHGFIKVFFKNI